MFPSFPFLLADYKVPIVDETDYDDLSPSRHLALTNPNIAVSPMFPTGTHHDHNRRSSVCRKQLLILHPHGEKPLQNPE
jgi:hypothetical protein